MGEAKRVASGNLSDRRMKRTTFNNNFLLNDGPSFVCGCRMSFIRLATKYTISQSWWYGIFGVKWKKESKLKVALQWRLHIISGRHCLVGNLYLFSLICFEQSESGQCGYFPQSNFTTVPATRITVNSFRKLSHSNVTHHSPIYSFDSEESKRGCKKGNKRRFSLRFFSMRNDIKASIFLVIFCNISFSHVHSYMSHEVLECVGMLLFL